MRSCREEPAAETVNPTPAGYLVRTRRIGQAETRRPLREVQPPALWPPVIGQVLGRVQSPGICRMRLPRSTSFPDVTVEQNLICGPLQNG